MGDSGSLFLGCMVGIMGAYSVKGQVNPNPVFLPALFLLFVPILDTGLAIIRRVIRRQHIFTSDANHIHHYCLKKGMSQVQTVFILYCVTLAMGLLSFFFLIES